MRFLLMLPGAFFAPIIHEWVKARVSAALGDPTPRKNGFLTWSPFKFFEPLGFFMMLYFQVGWGQPVTTSPFYYKNKRLGIALTYITPMVVNLFIGMLSLFLLSIFTFPLLLWANFIYETTGATWAFGVLPYFKALVTHFGQLNITLAVFNLIPVFPMAMNKLLHIFVSPETSMQLNHYEKPLQLLMFFLLIFGVLHRIIFPIANIFIRAVTF